MTQENGSQPSMKAGLFEPRLVELLTSGSVSIETAQALLEERAA